MSVLVMQIEDYNKPFLDALSQYDDGCDLSKYDFNQDGFGPPSDDVSKRKLAYRHRVIGHNYEEVSKQLTHITIYSPLTFIFSCAH